MQIHLPITATPVRILVHAAMAGGGGLPSGRFGTGGAGVLGSAIRAPLHMPPAATADTAAGL
jgi:hypothetical protein